MMGNAAGNPAPTPQLSFGMFPDAGANPRKRAGAAQLGVLALGVVGGALGAAGGDRTRSHRTDHTGHGRAECGTRNGQGAHAVGAVYHILCRRVAAQSGGVVPDYCARGRSTSRTSARPVRAISGSGSRTIVRSMLCSAGSLPGQAAEVW